MEPPTCRPCHPYESIHGSGQLYNTEKETYAHLAKILIWISARGTFKPTKSRLNCWKGSTSIQWRQRSMLAFIQLIPMSKLSLQKTGIPKWMMQGRESIYPSTYKTTHRWGRAMPAYSNKWIENYIQYSTPISKQQNWCLHTSAKAQVATDALWHQGYLKMPNGSNLQKKLMIPTTCISSKNKGTSLIRQSKSQNINKNNTSKGYLT